MENASKALLMAGAVLIAVLIINVAVRMFSSASSVTKTYDTQMEATESRTFNAHFTQFYGAPKENNETQQYATIHNIITTANFAIDQNKKNQGDDYTDTYDPIHVNITLAGNDEKIINIENLKTENYNWLIQNLYYLDNSKPDIKDVIHFEIKIEGQNNTGKINYVTFKADERSKSVVNNRLKNFKLLSPDLYN